MLLNLKIFKICIMHKIAPQKAKICKHAWKKYDYLKLLSHNTNICKVWQIKVTSLYKICMHSCTIMTKHAQWSRKIIQIWSIKIQFYIVTFLFFLKQCTTNFSKLSSFKLLHLSDCTFSYIENDPSTSQEVAGAYLSEEN